MHSVAELLPGTPVGHDSLPSEADLRRSIESRTYRQVSNLCVKRSGTRVTLRGCSSTYYVKQLATHAVLDLVPHADVENEITVMRP